MNHMAHREANEMFSKWIGILSSVLLISLIVFGYISNRIQKYKKMTLENFQTIKVEGMTCSHCEAAVTRNLSQLEGIEEVVADKNTAQVRIKGSQFNLAEIERIVTGLGYQFKGKL